MFFTSATPSKISPRPYASNGIAKCAASFTASRELRARRARTFNEFGLFLGIGGVLTFPKAQEVRDAVCEIGLGAIVLETDCPYLAPVPKRGKRNEPAYVTYTAAKLAELLHVPLAEVVAQTDANAATLFGI